jgi:hypothetical protein
LRISVLGALRDIIRRNTMTDLGPWGVEITEEVKALRRVVVHLAYRAGAANDPYIAETIERMEFLLRQEKEFDDG